MRKGVILKHNFRSTIVMTGKGEFVKAQKISGAEIGDEVSFEPKPASSFSLSSYKNMSAVTIAIIIIISLFPAYFWHDDNKAYAYVSIDINPSFEAKVNQDMEVISVEALNEDAESLLKNFGEWQGEPLTDVTSQLFEAVKEEGMVSNGENALVGVSYLSGQGNLDIIKQLQGFFDQKEDSFQIAAYAIPYEWKEEAEKAGESVHAIVNQRLTDDREAVELEADARKMLETFFQSEEKEEKNSDSPQDEEKDTTDKTTSKLEKTTPGSLERSESVNKPEESISSGEEKKSSTSEPAAKQKNHRKDKQVNDHSPRITNSNASGNEGEGPPDKGTEHPKNKGKAHPGNNGVGSPSVKEKETHPSNKKKENRSGNAKNESTDDKDNRANKDNKGKKGNKGKGKGPFPE
ncbi:anti-sigma factor domain-containing protein [Salimicrobium flavidum]|uniref:Anti-sigma factor N-terminus n=1 Tax=Salimicrobium flavidum TaxID=570947 RepID=A0A1N7JCS8_9BACI|nr:anti-sigma factor domain-containing protein [Salimicrobium flavidum]SIS47128.1 Anti-sigma factor N-terminus [Salimicrobium flavidum]